MTHDIQNVNGAGNLGAHPTQNIGRRKLLGLLGAGSALMLAGCDKLSQSETFTRVLAGGEQLTRAAQHLVSSATSMAQEFTAADISPEFRSNGTDNPQDREYQTLAAGNFSAYTLQVDGLVERPAGFTLAQLRALPSRTQITRHDCVEGWSAIGKWRGAKLSALLAQVRPKANARFVVFYCADPMAANGTMKYYESIDMEDAHHPQTILAYDLNDQPLPVKNGAPIRARIERQLGYKQAKYIMRIALVDSFANIAGGKGGYWEDQGYQWHAGI